MLSPDGCVVRDGGPGGADTLFSVAAEGGMGEPSPGADNLAEGKKLLQTPLRVRAAWLGPLLAACEGDSWGHGDTHTRAAASTSRKAESGAGKASPRFGSQPNWITGG